MNALKQELEIDDHKIPIAELYKRLKTHPENVNIFFQIVKTSLAYQLPQMVDL